MEKRNNRKWTLASRPVGMPKQSDFRLVELPALAPHDGEMLVHALYVSVDPYMRGRMNDAKSYAAPVEIGGVMVGGVVGEVVQSNNPRFAVGEIVQGEFGWQEYTVTNGKGARKVDPGLAPISTALGVLGMPGLTAYFGLLDIGKPQSGETVVVSGAAGAVGSIVGQIAKIKGCRAVGIAGSDDKVCYVVNELGFDGAFNYRSTKNYVEKLKELCPKGIDVYFDNVGGTITDAVIPLLNPRARLSICGQISQYNVKESEVGPRWLWALIVKQARAEGFLVFQFADRFQEAAEEMAGWIKQGKLKYREDIVEGFENLPRAFIGMLGGDNTGKRLVKVGDASG
ncbi:MAG: NADP-dependent oxidoreductase [Planctomycetia bacterium]|nr:NADP-dependent oxidoreductase [Planctomycetia bacterium]